MRCAQRAQPLSALLECLYRKAFASRRRPHDEIERYTNWTGMLRQRQAGLDVSVEGHSADAIRVW
ncbi:unnamed protein product [Ixodes pacificus]